MLEIEQAVLENLMMVVPFERTSPLIDTPDGMARFTRWCADSPAAQHLMETALADAPVFELDDKQNIFILSVDYAEAESLLQCLVSAYEDEDLERLINHS